MKLGGHVGCVTRKNWFDFGEDPNPDLDEIIIYFLKWFFTIVRLGQKRYGFPVLGLERWRSPSGLSAVDLKVKFPVVICPVLTVYFLTYMLLCVPSSVLFQKSCYVVSFCRPCLTEWLRPTHRSPRCTIVCICIFSPLPSISIFPTFPTSPIPPN